MRLAQSLSRQSDDLLEIEDEFALSVIEGLSKVRKSLPCRYFYDARGSELFEEITRLEEYYPTRTEAGILAAHAAEITEGIGDGDPLLEFGSGSSVKTEILLDRVAQRVAYVPIDVSGSALIEAEQRLRRRYPGLDIRPIMADFAKPISLPADISERRKTGFFPGSTLGNLVPRDAADLLAAFGRAVGGRGRLIIGIDLKKDPRVLVQAYNDARGVTAAFNLNLLERINRELDGTFAQDAFRHEAIYEPREGRIEMHLISTRDQDVEVLGRRFHFRDGESVHTENSYKYTISQFRDLARHAGWQPVRLWTDKQNHFSVHELRWE